MLSFDKLSKLSETLSRTNSYSLEPSCRFGICYSQLRVSYSLHPWLRMGGKGCHWLILALRPPNRSNLTMSTPSCSFASKYLYSENPTAEVVR